MKNQRRIQRYCALNTELSLIKDSDLANFLRKYPASAGWGRNHLVKLSGQKVFVKRVPLTRLEYENAFDASNLFRLPLFYNYGVGSAGFGAFRELFAHVKTTNWVLNWEIENFPLLYHYRILSRSEKPNPLDRKKHAAYVRRWNSSKAVDHYIRERNKAPHELVLFLEYFPHTLGPWLTYQTGKINSMARELYEVVNFLNQRGILHFDLHVHNILSDGQVPYIADFGLALDRDLLTSKEERSFFRRHQQYDLGKLIGSLGTIMEFQYRDLNASAKAKIARDFGITDELNSPKRLELLIDQAESLKRSGFFDLSASYIRFLRKKRDVICLMNSFSFAQRSNPRKNTKFDAQRLKGYLKNSIA